jgi:hypothetical protein
MDACAEYSRTLQILQTGKCISIDGVIFAKSNPSTKLISRLTALWNYFRIRPLRSASTRTTLTLCKSAPRYSIAEGSRRHPLWRRSRGRRQDHWRRAYEAHQYQKILALSCTTSTLFLLASGIDMKIVSQRGQMRN